MTTVAALRPIKARARAALVRAGRAARAEETSRTTLLALAELLRREQLGRGAHPAAALAPYELRVFSQNGEDGVIAEILRRSGTVARYFVELGAGPGHENNCALLADVFGWSGLYAEADAQAGAALEARYAHNPRVRTEIVAVTPRNLQSILDEAGVPPEFDILSVDVDGSDYWLWEALTEHRPRLVVIEYNAALPHDQRLVAPLDPGHRWDGTEFFGASLGALRALAAVKGYRLVHTDLTGTNAFFIREDLPGDYPPPHDVPLRAANYYLSGRRHPPDPQTRAYVEVDPGRAGRSASART
jgi:hypothetical protein